MSTQRLSAKSTRRVARQLENPTITRAWVNNGYSHDIIFYTTWQHEHGAFNRKTGEHIELPDSRENHYTSCYDESGDLLEEVEPFENDGRWPTAGGES